MYKNIIHGILTCMDKNIIDFSNFGLKHPFLVYDIWDYFLDKTKKSTRKIPSHYPEIFEDMGIKSAFDFFITFKDIYSINESDETSYISYKTVDKICNILCEHDYFLKQDMGIPSLDGGFNYYVGFKETGTNKKILSRHKDNKMVISYILNCVVYGFKYIYELNKKNVLPMYVKKNDSLYIGTCFKTVHGIVTAKHCISNTKSIQIGGITKEELFDCNILTKDNLDLVIIQLNKSINLENYILTSNCFILDEIMVMGYPSHSGFDNFITATIGSIAAIEKSYLTKYDLMLLTSKVKGGNSGGPVFNNQGYVVGVVTETPNPKGEGYDQFGYGLAMPQYYIEEIIKSGKKLDEKINFE